MILWTIWEKIDIDDRVSAETIGCVVDGLLVRRPFVNLISDFDEFKFFLLILEEFCI